MLKIVIILLVSVRLSMEQSMQRIDIPITLLHESESFDLIKDHMTNTLANLNTTDKQFGIKADVVLIKKRQTLELIYQSITNCSHFFTIGKHVYTHHFFSERL